MVLSGLPKGGGVSRRRLALAKYFYRKGLKIDVLCFMPKCETSLHNEYEKVARIVSLENVITRRFRNNIFSLLNINKLINYIIDAKPANILSAMEYPNYYTIKAKIKAGYGGKVVISQHGHMKSIKEERSLIKKLITDRIWSSYRFADAVIAVSPGIREELIKIGCHPDKVSVINNPVIDDDLYSKAEENPNHIWYKNKIKNIILSIGRLEWEKDYATLIKAFAIVNDCIDARMMIIGDGSMRGELQNLVYKLKLKDKVSMPGIIDNPYPYLKNSDVFVLSSKYEGMVGVIIEALGLGTPVISTDCPTSPRELLHDGVYGELVPVGNYKLLAEKIIKYLSNPKRDTHAAQEWIKSKYSVEKAAEEYLKLLI